MSPEETPTKNPSAAALPVNLEAIPKAHHFPSQRHRWNTNEEIAAILICFDKHEDWLSKEVKIRPKSGSMLLYSRKRVRYRRDGYCWKKRKDGKTTREDHMKLKVQGTECIYGCYVHSAILPTFHRRCYWLLQNPDIVLVHYLNVPYSSDDNKALISPSLSYCADKKEWTKEELVSQLKPMFYSETKPDLNNELEISMAETVETIVQQLMDKQRSKPRAGDCSCDNKNKVQKNVINKCAPTLHCIISPKAVQQQNNNNVSSGSGGGVSGGQRDPESRPTAAVSGGSVILATPCRPSEAGSAATSLILNLSQLQGGGGLLILNGTSPGSARMSLASSSAGVTPLTLICNQDPNTTAPTTLPNNTSSSQASSYPSLSTAPTTTSSISANTLISAAALAAAARNNGTTHHVLKMSKLPSNNLLNLHNNGIKVMTSSSATTNSPHQQTLPSEAMQIQESQQPTVISHSTHKDSIMEASDTPEKKNAHHLPSSEGNSLSPLVTQQQKGDTKSLPQLPQPQKKANVSTSTKNFIGLSQTELHKSIAAALFHAPKDYYTLSQEALQKTLTATSLLSISPSSTSSTLTTSMSNTTITNSVMSSANQDVTIKREEEQPQGTTNNASHEDEINPMDFIDTEICSAEDDVYNFDNLDILPDLPNLDDLCLPTYLYPNGSSLDATHPPPSSLSSPVLRDGTTTIIDYSPEWSFTEGGSKVLVVGPWTSGSTPYSVLFDSMSVPTTLVQNGVLRCHCPAHEAGLVTVQVACNGFVISNSVTFEYRERQPPTRQEWYNVDVNGLKYLLLERLEWLETKIKGSATSAQPAESQAQQRGNNERIQPANFEDRVVATVQRFMGGLWSDDHGGGGILSRPDLSLLHLAAALGFTRLVCALLRWRAENPSLLLESEVDALSQDRDDCTPLMWACSQGHREVAALLFQWNRAAANILDCQGRNPFAVAKEQGFEDIVQDLEQLDDSASSLLENMEAGGKVRKLSSAQPESGGSVLQGSGFSSIPRTSSPRHLPDILSSIPQGSAQLFAGGTSQHGLRPGLVKRSSVDSILGQSFNWGSNGGDKRASLDQRLLFSPILGQTTSLLDSRTCTLGDSNQTLAGGISRGEDGFPGASGDTTASDSRVLTLAEQIIAAMPDRIKATSRAMETSSQEAPDSAMEMSPVDEPPPPFLNDEFNFEFSDHNYRYCEGTGTPASSLSPASPSCLQSPGSGFNTAPLDSPPPTTADFSEFLQASGKIVEKDFSNLTLSDTEQRELYEAAKIIQKAYRSYKGRKQQEEQEKERGAAVLIQSYYRRYKQYMYYKQMSRAAQVIQTQYRTYCEHKRFKKGSELGGSGGGFLHSGSPPSYYAAHHAGLSDASPATSGDKRSSREGTPTSGLKRTYSQRRQHQAARKIQQFMRQSKNKLQRERALAAANELKQESVAQPPHHHQHPGVGPPPPPASTLLDPQPPSNPPSSSAGGCCWV